MFRLEDELDLDRRIPQLTVLDLSRRLDLSVEHSLQAVEICAPGPCCIGAFINGFIVPQHRETKRNKNLRAELHAKMTTDTLLVMDAV